MEQPRHSEHLVHAGPPPRLTLLSLPNEILTLILSNFCLHCIEQRDGPGAGFFTPQSLAPARGRASQEPSWASFNRQALHAVCLVSTRLRDVGQRVLYHQFAPGYGDSIPSNRDSWSHRLLPFLRTVARRRDLAAVVQHVQLELGLFVDLLPNHVHEVLRDAAEARGIDLHHFLARFGEYTRLGSPYPRDCPQTDELVTMLVACLPNLARLNLAGGGAFKCIPVAALRTAGITSLGVQAIDFSCASEFGDSSLGGILDLPLPSLTALSISFPEEKSLRSINRLPPSLRHLYITQAESEGPALAALLSRCVMLETFVFESEVDSEPAPGQTMRPCFPLLTPDCVEHLLRNKESLRALHIDFKAVYGVSDQFVNDAFLTKLTPRLRHFPVLQSLFLNTTVVYGTADDEAEGLTVPLGTILPPSIVSLTMVENALVSPTLANLSADLCRIAEAALQGQFPSLKAVTCDTPMPLDDSGLGDLFAQAGVDFRYEDCPLSGRAHRRRRR